MNKIQIYERVKEVGNYVVLKNSTVRETAKAFNVSKSTIHKDLTARLETIDPVLYMNARKVQQTNLENRHLRGGEATKQKYLKK